MLNSLPKYPPKMVYEILKSADHPMVNVEEDYQACARLLAREEAKTVNSGKRKGTRS